jgi:hypothetical protein
MRANPRPPWARISRVFGRSGIPKMPFDVAMAPLLGVQIRCIRWQPFHLNLGVCGDILLDEYSPMRIQSIPDDDHRRSDVPLDVADGPALVDSSDSQDSPGLAEVAWPRC